jgi:hypothetical protein
VPTLADPAALQDNVVNTACREAPAHDKTGLATADDDDISLQHLDKSLDAGNGPPPDPGPMAKRITPWPVS